MYNPVKIFIARIKKRSQSDDYNVHERQFAIHGSNSLIRTRALATNLSSKLRAKLLDGPIDKLMHAEQRSAPGWQYMHTSGDPQGRWRLGVSCLNPSFRRTGTIGRKDCSKIRVFLEMPKVPERITF